jgi:mono/diheme cytochrome c family protein
MSKPFRTAAAFALSLISWSAVSAAEQPDSALVERGRYLVEVAAFCGACHAARGPKGEPLQGMELAGGRVIEDRGFRAVVPNITPDLETGIGRWTNEQIAAAVRDGHRPDGSLIGPPMPVESYRGISDRDLTAIVVFLRTMPPIRHAISERSHYPFKLTSHGPAVVSVPDPPKDNPVKRGEYLAVHLAHCMDCHSPQLSEGKRDAGRPGAPGVVLEGPWGSVQARNISSHPEHGIGRWTDEQILRAITQGKSADGRQLAPPMAARAPVWSKLTEPDKRDLVAYIRSLPPQE